MELLDGVKVKWKHHPLFDDPLSQIVVPPYPMSYPGSRVIVRVEAGLYFSVIEAMRKDPNVVLCSDTNDFEVVAASIQEDFFENVYELLLKRSDSTPFKSPVTSLRFKLMTTEMFLSLSNGLIIKDPLSPFTILNSTP
jgi:hypothetical protein